MLSKRATRSPGLIPSGVVAESYRTATERVRQRTSSQNEGNHMECPRFDSLRAANTTCSDDRLMTSPEETTDDQTTDSITLTITDLDLPESDAERRALLDTLKQTLTEHLRTRLDQPAVEITACVGHQYAMVTPTCPDCGESLDLTGIHLGDGPDAYAVARCNAACGWTGDGVFTLTDLDRHVGERYASAVLAGDVTPDYQPYQQRTD